MLVKSDYQTIKTKQGKKTFKKKSAWRKYARAFRLTDEILEKEIIKNKHGRVDEASFVVKVMGGDGRSTIGYGNASINEGGFKKPNHDIPTTAHTRAKNRAISDYIGAGEVSAEEIEFKNDTKKLKSAKPDEDKLPPGIDPENIQDAEPEAEVGDIPVEDVKNRDNNNPIITEEQLFNLKKLSKKLDETIGNDEYTRKDILALCQDLLGENELTPDDFRMVKKVLGMNGVK